MALPERLPLHLPPTTTDLKTNPNLYKMVWPDFVVLYIASHIFKSFGDGLDSHIRKISVLLSNRDRYRVRSTVIKKVTRIVIE